MPSPMRFVLLALAVGATSASCQSAQQPSDCVGLSLDVTPHFYLAPGDLRVVAIDLHNPTPQACTLRPDGGPAQGPLLVLLPGETAHTTFRWTSLPAGAYEGPELKAENTHWSPTLESGASSNQPAKLPENCHDLPSRIFAVNHGLASLIIDSSTLLPPVCSEVRYDPYLPGPFFPDWQARQTAPSSPPPIVTLEASKQSYTSREAIRFHLSVRGADASVRRSRLHCPVLIRQTRTASRLIVLATEAPADDEPGNYAISMLRQCDPLSQALDAVVAPELIGERKPGELQNQTVQYLVVAGLQPTGEVRLVASNLIAFTVRDPSPPDTWGKPVKGIRTALKLDKTSYQLGEDIPLHIAAQVLPGSKPVYATADVPRTGSEDNFLTAFQLTIFDSNSASANNPQRDGLWRSPVSSGGVTICPRPLNQGEIFLSEASSSALGLLPAKPGRYQLILSWSPYAASGLPCAANSRRPRRGRKLWKGKIFATVSSAPIWIEIAPASGQALRESTSPMRQ